MTLSEAKVTNLKAADFIEVGLLIYPDCQLAAVYGLTDLFRVAGDWATDLQEPTSLRKIRVSHWTVEDGAVSCTWDSETGASHSLSYIIAPPSIVMPEKMQSMRPASKWLSSQHALGVTVCSICAGAFVLAETGLIDGRRATTHWAFAERLAERFPKIDVLPDNMIIDDGDLITAGGILAWADLGLLLVEKLLGQTVMLETARFLVVDPPRRSQSQYKTFIPRFDHGDKEVRQIQHQFHAAPELQKSIGELADSVHLSERTLQRRFLRATGLKLTEYLQSVRIMKARQLLETTNGSVESIAWAVGYADPAAFRKIFGRLTGATPNVYRGDVRL
ncbi:GlxA family transcriptional regulator [Agrobacterium pusense]|uniref:GlxA family transcriptional regulator n=1 Tax=Agrobacterium pusense TaxID=648995 RepID=UPI003FCF9F67